MPGNSAAPRCENRLLPRLHRTSPRPLRRGEERSRRPVAAQAAAARDSGQRARSENAHPLAKPGEKDGAPNAELLHFDRGSRLGELLLDGLGFFLVHALFHGLGRAVHQVLGFFQAQAGDFTDSLNHVDLVRANGSQDDRKFGLLFRRSRSRTRRRRPRPPSRPGPQPPPRRRDALPTSSPGPPRPEATVLRFVSSNCCRSAMSLSTYSLFVVLISFPSLRFPMCHPRARLAQEAPLTTDNSISPEAFASKPVTKIAVGPGLRPRITRTSDRLGLRRRARTCKPRP